jgi:hypothetical protein
MIGHHGQCLEFAAYTGNLGSVLLDPLVENESVMSANSHSIVASQTSNAQYPKFVTWDRGKGREDE